MSIDVIERSTGISKQFEVRLMGKHGMDVDVNRMTKGARKSPAKKGARKSPAKKAVKRPRDTGARKSPAKKAVTGRETSATLMKFTKPELVKLVHRLARR